MVITAREAAVDISGREWFSMGELKDELDLDEGEDQRQPSGHVRGLRSSAAGLRAPDGLLAAVRGTVGRDAVRGSSSRATKPTATGTARTIA